jgi:hypothetical protein
MKECNVCKKFKCKVPNLYRRNKTSLTPEDMAKSCKDVQEPKPWTVKMIFHLLQKSPQAVHDVLRANKMRLQELDRKPYFRIILEK